MNDSRKWVTLVSKLLEATQSGRMKWQPRDAGTQGLPQGERAVLVYVGDYEGQRFRVYEYQEKFYIDEVTWDWAGNWKLEFIDEAGHSLFEVPLKGVGIRELLEAVKYQSAAVDSFLQKIGAA